MVTQIILKLGAEIFQVQDIIQTTKTKITRDEYGTLNSIFNLDKLSPLYIYISTEETCRQAHELQSSFKKDSQYCMTKYFAYYSQTENDTVICMLQSYRKPKRLNINLYNKTQEPCFYRVTREVAKDTRKAQRRTSRAGLLILLIKRIIDQSQRALYDTYPKHG